METRNYTYYMFTTSAPGSNGMYELNETAPTYATTAYGWIVGTIAAGGFQDMDFQTEVARTVFQTNPYASLNTGANTGNAMRTPRMGALFKAESRVQVTMSIKAVTNGGSMDGIAVYRFWKGSDPVGTGAQLISSTFYSSSIVTNLATTAHQVVSASITLPAFRLSGEYLFVHVQWGIQGAGGAVGNDCDMFVGPTSQSVVKFIDVRPTQRSGVVFSHDEDPWFYNP